MSARPCERWPAGRRRPEAPGLSCPHTRAADRHRGRRRRGKGTEFEHVIATSRNRSGPASRREERARTPEKRVPGGGEYDGYKNAREHPLSVRRPSASPSVFPERRRLSRPRGTDRLRAGPRGSITDAASRVEVDPATLPPGASATFSAWATPARRRTPKAPRRSANKRPWWPRTRRPRRAWTRCEPNRPTRPLKERLPPPIHWGLMPRGPEWLARLNRPPGNPAADTA